MTAIKAIKTNKYPPGDFLLWMIIYVELFTFGLLFVGYAFVRKSNESLFNHSQTMLNPTSGYINTLLLLTASYCLVKAVHCITSMNKETIHQANKKASKWLLFAILCGLSFSVIKGAEFTHLFSEGITLSTNKFFMFYLLLTGFHFMHVILGIVILFNTRQKTIKQGYTNKDHVGIESAAAYWHMVDLLWIILFPLIYIIH